MQTTSTQPMMTIFDVFDVGGSGQVRYGQRNHGRPLQRRLSGEFCQSGRTDRLIRVTIPSQASFSRIG